MSSNRKFSHLHYSQFEELISQTIEETKDLPESMSETGRIRMSHKGKPRPLIYT
jgi:uncharacterized Rmd1/YagE family protein